MGIGGAEVVAGTVIVVVVFHGVVDVDCGRCGNVCQIGGEGHGQAR